MTFKSYAEGRGFKNYHVQMPIAQAQNQIRREGEYQLAFSRRRAAEHRATTNEVLQHKARNAQIEETNRDRAFQFRERNLDAIHQQEIENFKRRVESHPRSSKNQQTILDKIAPLVELGTNFLVQQNAIREAERKASFQQAHNMVVATGLTSKQYNTVLNLEQAIRDETTEGVQALYEINEKNGLVGENVFTAENLFHIRNQTGEYQMLINHQLALNSFQRFDPYLRSTMHEVDPEVGLSLHQAFNPKYNTNWNIRELLWNKRYGAFAQEQGINLHELPASVAGGSFSERINKVKSAWFGAAGRADDQYYQSEDNKSDVRAFETALFSVKFGDNPLALQNLHQEIAQRTFTPEGKPNYNLANEQMYESFKTGIQSGIVSATDIDDWVSVNGKNMGRIWTSKYQQLKHEAEKHRAQAVQDKQTIDKTKQIELRIAWEHEFETDTESAQTFLGLSLNEKKDFLIRNGFTNDNASKFLTKHFAGKVGRVGSEIDQAGKYSVLKEWIPQQLANYNGIKETDLKKVLGHANAENNLLNIATNAYNAQWQQTKDPNASFEYAKASVDEALNRGRYSINKDKVMIDGVEQVRSIDGVGQLQFSFDSFWTPGKTEQLDETRARVTQTFTGKTKEEGLNMVRAISNEEQAAAIMPRSVIAQSTVGGKFDIRLFRRHAAVQRALEETGAPSSFLADQLLRGYGLPGLDPDKVTTPEELNALSSAGQAAYRERENKYSSYGEAVNAVQIGMNEVVGFTGGVVGQPGSGQSSGAHAHIESGNGERDHPDRGLPVPADVLSRVLVAGKPMSSYTQTAGLGDGRGHQGFDFATPAGLPITLTGGLRLINYDDVRDPDGYGYSIWIKDTVNGRDYLIGHLSAGPSQ